MKSKSLKLFLVCLIPVIFFTACSSGGSSDNDDNNEEAEEKEFFHYVDSETGFTGTATWQASNDAEKSMFLFVGKMHFDCEDSQGNELWGRWVSCTINTSNYTVTATLTTNDGEILKYADIPGIKIKAYLHFNLNGQPILVAEQNGLKGPEAYGDIPENLTVDYFLRYMSKTGTYGNNTEKTLIKYGGAWASGNYKNRENPIIKVTSINIENKFTGYKYKTTIDWNDTVSKYKENGCYKYHTDSDSSGSYFSPAFNIFYKRDGYGEPVYYCITSEDYYSSLSDSTWQKSDNFCIYVSVTSTNGKTYEFVTSIDELKDIE